MRRIPLLIPGLFAALVALGGAAADASGAQAVPITTQRSTIEIRDSLRNPHNPESLLIDNTAAARSLRVQAEGEAAEAQIGDQLTWVALNDIGGFYYPKMFELRAANDTCEIWIAVGEGMGLDRNPDGITGLDFPGGDCRNDGVRNVVTDDQAAYLLDQFTNNIKATVEIWFGPPDFRDGSAGLVPRPSPGGRQVVLVDNVRDDNFYDTGNANVLPLIAGFYTSAMITYHDRNVMTIDGYDWLHRTGADPAHDPSSDPCTNAPARPFLYEGIFAHEYQHLIHHDYDSDEVTWVNEGMSELAMLLTGYSDPSLHIDEEGNDNHPLSYQGWLSVAHPDWNPIPRPSGPENSLTVWGDQGDAEILEDYGFAYTFMVYLYDRGYGLDFFQAWHHNPLDGIDGLNDTLAVYGHGSGGGGNGESDTFQSLFADMIISTLTDAYVDAGARVTGESADAVSSDSLSSTVYFSPEAYASPGAPPWGADYIPLGSGNNLRTLEFDGDDFYIHPGGNDWTIDAYGYWTTPDVPGETTYTNRLDSSIAREVSVPETGGTLIFEHWYQTERGWDFAFVQVLTENGFVSLSCTGTTTDDYPDATPNIAANVPGYTGPSENPDDPSTAGTPDAPLAATCDLTQYAGQDIVLAFRLMSDWSITFNGWHIRNVRIDGVPVDPTPDDLSDWDNEQFFLPIGLNFQLTLVGLSGSVDSYGHVTQASDVVIVRPNLLPGLSYLLTNADREQLEHSQQVVAIVAGIPEDETRNLYFPYSLRVNGKQMADGAGIEDSIPSEVSCFIGAAAGGWSHRQLGLVITALIGLGLWYRRMPGR